MSQVVLFRVKTTVNKYIHDSGSRRSETRFVIKHWFASEGLRQ